MYAVAGAMQVTAFRHCTLALHNTAVCRNPAGKCSHTSCESYACLTLFFHHGDHAS